MQPHDFSRLFCHVYNKQLKETEAPLVGWMCTQHISANKCITLNKTSQKVGVDVFI